MTDCDVTKHALVPKHIKVGEKEKTDILKTYSITLKELPKVHARDPSIQHLDTKEGDVIKITRQSPTAGEISFYRRVIQG